MNKWREGLLIAKISQIRGGNNKTALWAVSPTESNKIKAQLRRRDVYFDSITIQQRQLDGWFAVEATLLLTRHLKLSGWRLTSICCCLLRTVRYNNHVMIRWHRELFMCVVVRKTNLLFKLTYCTVENQWRGLKSETLHSIVVSVISID